MKMNPSAELAKVVTYLTEHASPTELAYLYRRYPDYESLETWDELCIMKMLLCRRSPTPSLPSDILASIDDVLVYERSQKLLTSSVNLLCINMASIEKHRTRISLWKGDITTLTQTTAIVNAANSQLLGCFAPHHKCIDNAIHGAAGPRLRDECFTLMSEQGSEESVGQAKVTKGYCLLAEYVLHTVGPQIAKGEVPTGNDHVLLGNCYLSCLEACEKLPALEDGRKVLAFCCISTGVFGFPSKLAAETAVASVEGWLSRHPETTITDIIFNVFSEADNEMYSSILSPSRTLQIPKQVNSQPSPAIAIASKWVRSANRLLITAGAGLSASAGLDYNSKPLFEKEFPAFTLPPYNFTCLYDLIRPLTWPSEEARWGYYFKHFLMVRNWPVSSVYQDLLSIAESFDDGNVHVRTSNVDGFFVKNGFNEDIVSTPQGQYAYIQCATPCKAAASFESKPFIDAAAPFLDPKTQMLTDSSKIPHCKFCGGKLVLCARMGRQFLENRFAGQEGVYRSFRDKTLHPQVSLIDAVGCEEEMTVILELGVGLSTIGVLRWPDEDLVARGDRRVKLIRIGLEAGGCVDWEDENMVGIQGDIGEVLKALVLTR